MVAIILFILLQAMYFIVISFIIKKDSRSKETIQILPPENPPSNVPEPSASITSPLRGVSANLYLNAIVTLLLENGDPLRIVKFLNSVPNERDKDFFLNHLRTQNPKLHDTVFALLGIDVEAEDFDSKEISQTPAEILPDFDIPELSKEEEIVQGGLPLSLFKEEMDFTGVQDFSEYLRQIDKIYIARILSQTEKQQIEEIAEQITSTSPASSLTPGLVKKTFQKGISVAKSIQEEIKEQKNTN